MLDDFVVDLDDHELTRRALVAEATPWTVEQRAAADEAVAWHGLYSGLDEAQREVYDMLVEQGVLPSEF